MCREEGLVAAHAMLDHEHPDLTQPSADINNYTLGDIGRHNVVIVCLPSEGAGIILAAAASARMGCTFPSLQYMLLVGAASGIPSEQTDIRLGDVVVSTKGTIHYDWGKILSGERFVRSTEALIVRPHIRLQNGATKLRSTLQKANRNISDHLCQVIEENKKLPENFRQILSPDEDRLFDARYEHSSSKISCHWCNPQYQIPRMRRDQDGPHVHYGLVASGSIIIRDTITRDRIGHDLQALCLDTEAAGLINTYPAMIIRGISNYADSHNSLGFHNYALAIASAYAKELLNCTLTDGQDGMTNAIS